MTDGREPVFDPREILRSLVEHQVEFTVVGGLAVQVHGYMRSTRDLDVVPAAEMVNISRLGEALGEMEARCLRTQRPLDVTNPHLLERAPLVPLMTRYGRLDLLHPKLTRGAPGSYDKLRANAVLVGFADTKIAVAGLDDLIRMKRAAGRDQDLADIGALTRSDEDLEREAREST